MEYRTADTIGRTSLSALTARMMNQKDIGLLGGLTEASKMKFEAARTRVKSKFDPLNIVRALTFKSPMLTAAAGRLMGRSKRDISYFTGGRYGDDSLGETPTTSRRKNDGVYHTRIGPGKSTNLKVGDGIADILAKLYNLNRLIHSENKKLDLANKISDKENEQERNRFLKFLFGDKDNKAKKIEDNIIEESSSAFGLASLLPNLKKIFTAAAFIALAGTTVWAIWKIIKDKFELPKLLPDNIPNRMSTFEEMDKNIKNQSALAPVNMNDIEYLQTTAMLESSGNEKAVAKKSSAAGAFQFTKDTWTDVVNKMGKDWTLEDRFDKKKSAEAARWLAKDNERILKYESFKSSNINEPVKPVSQQEVYMAHVLGAGTAARLIKEKNKSPFDYPTFISEKEKKNNPSYFYADEKMTKPLTNQQVYDTISKKYNSRLDLVRSGKVPEMVKQIPQSLGVEQPIKTTPQNLKPIEKSDKLSLNSSLNPVYGRVQAASTENVNMLGSGNKAPVIVAPVTNNYVGAGGKGSPQNSFNSGVSIPVRNDEPGIYLAQTKYSLFKTT